MTQVSKAKRRVGLVYDSRMELHECDWLPDTQDSPQRLTRPLATCQQMGLLEKTEKINARHATEDEIKLVHPQKCIELVKASESMTTEERIEYVKKFEACWMGEKSYQAALLAVGGSIDATKAVISGQLDSALALVRPPGHHAHDDQPQGHCLFNNVAIAAKYALEKSGLERVMIVDWDIHCGNGTHLAIQDDPRILFFNIFVSQNGLVWPFDKRMMDSNMTRKQKNRVNIPLDITGVGDQDYLAIFDHLIVPMAQEFQPQLILVSSGFDSALGDRMGFFMRLTPAGYAHMTRKLMHIGAGKLCVLLEGGYYLKSLEHGVAAVLSSLLGEPIPSIVPINKLETPMGVHPSVAESIWKLMKICADQGWNCCQNAVKLWQKSREMLGLETNYEPFELYIGSAMFNKAQRQPSGTSMLELVNLFFYVMGPHEAEIEAEVTLSKLLKLYQYRHCANRIAVCASAASDVSKIESDFNLLQLNHRVVTVDQGNRIAMIDGTGTVDIAKLLASAAYDCVKQDQTEAAIVLSNSRIYGEIINSLMSRAFHEGTQRAMVIDFREAQGDSDFLVLPNNLYVSIFGKSALKNKFGENYYFGNYYDELQQGDFALLLQHVILPMAFEYQPKLLVFIPPNAGYVSNSITFDLAVQQLSSLADGRTIVLMESMLEQNCTPNWVKSLTGEKYVAETSNQIITPGFIEVLAKMWHDLYKEGVFHSIKSVILDEDAQIAAIGSVIQSLTFMWDTIKGEYINPNEMVMALRGAAQAKMEAERKAQVKSDMGWFSRLRSIFKKA